MCAQEDQNLFNVTTFIENNNVLDSPVSKKLHSSIFSAFRSFFWKPAVILNSDHPVYTRVKTLNCRAAKTVYRGESSGSPTTLQANRKGGESIFGGRSALKIAT